MTLSNVAASVAESFLALPIALVSMRATVWSQLSPYFALHSRSTKGASPELTICRAFATRSLLLIATAHAPTLPMAHVLRGGVAEAVGELDEARASFQAAVRLEPSAPHQLLLGGVADRLGDVDLAMQSLESGYGAWRDHAAVAAGAGAAVLGVCVATRWPNVGALARECPAQVREAATRAFLASSEDVPQYQFRILVEAGRHDAAVALARRRGWIRDTGDYCEAPDQPVSEETAALLCALLPRIDWAAGFTDEWEPGERGAQKRLRAFVKKGLPGYDRDRSRLDVEGSSRLSPHLRFGEISPRQMCQAVKADGGGRGPAAKAFLAELGWREFAYHLLFHLPQTPRRPLRTAFEKFPWKRRRAALSRWQRGLTGYPIVDAGMRELWATGWMHNRVRMIVASFLTKHLLIDWREGEAWFWDTLVDADAANNARLIGDLAHLPPAQRTAHYYCVLVLLRAHDDPQPVIADASWHGEVIDTPHGRGGFGYDPHFLIPELGCTVAELDPVEKNRLGHRGQAMRALVERLDRFAVVADATQGP